MIAALYVATNGVYFGLPDVDPWDIRRDARTYPGPHPVVAHPPCERWGRYWFGGPSVRIRRELGDDGGCFDAALASVRAWGGVLEHPEGSHAWRVFGLNVPPKCGGWVNADFLGGWTCCVEQGHYGHPARKATWLYAFGVPELPALTWGACAGKQRLDEGWHSTEERRMARANGRRPTEAPRRAGADRHADRLPRPAPFPCSHRPRHGGRMTLAIYPNLLVANGGVASLETAVEQLEFAALVGRVRQWGGGDA